MKYRKKPVEVEAIQFLGDVEEAFEFTEGKALFSLDDFGMEIETLEGKMIAKYDDYIIKGVQGEFYPCKPDIFKETYDKVE